MKIFLIISKIILDENSIHGYNKNWISIYPTSIEYIEFDILKIWKEILQLEILLIILTYNIQITSLPSYFLFKKFSNNCTILIYHISLDSRFKRLKIFNFINKKITETFLIRIYRVKLGKIAKNI